MLFSLKDLIGFTAEATDFTARVEDVFIDKTSWSVGYVLLDIGGWFENKLVLVSGARIGEVQPDARSFTLNVSKADTETAAQVHTLKSLPALILADKVDEAGCLTALNAVDNETLFSLKSATATKAANSGGEVGQIVDFLGAQGDLQVSHIVVDTGLTLPETQRVLPVSEVLQVGHDDLSTLLRTDKAKLDAGPKLEMFDGLDRHWIDKVGAYYGLS